MGRHRCEIELFDCTCEDGDPSGNLPIFMPNRSSNFVRTEFNTATVQEGGYTISFRVLVQLRHGEMSYMMNQQKALDRFDWVGFLHPDPQTIL